MAHSRASRRMPATALFATVSAGASALAARRARRGSPLQVGRPHVPAFPRGGKSHAVVARSALGADDREDHRRAPAAIAAAAATILSAASPAFSCVLGP